MTCWSKTVYTQFIDSYDISQHLFPVRYEYDIQYQEITDSHTEIYQFYPACNGLNIQGKYSPEIDYRKSSIGDCGSYGRLHTLKM